MSTRTNQTRNKASSKGDLVLSGYESFEQARRALAAAGFKPYGVEQPQAWALGDEMYVVAEVGNSGEVVLVPADDPRVVEARHNPHG